MIRACLGLYLINIVFKSKIAFTKSVFLTIFSILGLLKVFLIFLPNDIFCF
jgi:hypothetical protein